MIVTLMIAIMIVVAVLLRMMMVVMMSLSLVEVPTIVEVVSMTTASSSKSSTSEASLIVMINFKREYDWRWLWSLLTEVTENLILVSETMTEFFFELFNQGDFQGIQFRLIAIIIIVIAWKIQVNLSIGVSHNLFL